MRNAFDKDVYREIRNTAGRFMGIFAIVALGVSFYCGIGATGYDMKVTGDSYFIEQNLMDIRVVSSYGLNKKDIEAIGGVSGIREISPAYNIDAQVLANGNATILKVHGIDFTVDENKRINNPLLREGRMPTKSSEAVVESNFLRLTGYEIGDTIRLESGKKRDIRNSLKTDLFTIVGIVRSPYYISHERGNGSIGSGEIDCYIIIPQENFTDELYSEAFITVAGANEVLSSGKQYEEMVDKVIKDIEAVGELRTNERFKQATVMSYAKLNEAEKELRNNLNNAYAQYGESNEITESLESALAETEKSRQKLDDLDEPKWYVLDRDSNAGYAGFSGDADKIEAIGNVFPLIFFLVAALVSLTTMTRLVEERRTEIGTLKSLGYDNFKIMSKYIIYAVAPTLLGGLLGGYAGMQLFPTVIINAYNTMYTMPVPITPVSFPYWAKGISIAVACTTIAAVFACLNELRATPANLMRPKSPKSGKRTVIERIKPLWASLSFTQKVTVRNILRYKKRFFMTVIGIAGCTALLMTGFGLRDSISDIVGKQFGDIYNYNMTVNFSDGAKNSNVSNVMKTLNASSAVDRSLIVRQKSMDAGIDEKADTAVTLVVPDDTQRFGDFIELRDKTTHEPIEISDGGVVVTTKLAKNFNLKKGDFIYIKDGDDKIAKTRVTDITEHYFLHSVYMSASTYKALFDEDVEYNAIFSVLANDDESEHNKLANSILDKKAVTSVFFNRTTVNTFNNVIKSLNFVVFVLIVSAGALAFVVLLNLTNININERIRELATIEVLGFYDREVSDYVFRENFALTAIGIALGFVLGVMLHSYIMTTVETDNMMFGNQIKAPSYLYSMLLTAFFAWCVNMFLSGKLKKINMVEALKSME